MTLNVTNPWIAIPAAALYCGLGALASGAVFNKLSHLAEYTLNKRFGDYATPQKTLDNKIIVSMSIHKNCYNLQNIALATLVAAISSKAVQTLFLAGCPTLIAVPLLVGSVAAPIFFNLFNMVLYNTGGYRGRWVEISDAEINKHGINKNDIEAMPWSARVYSGFGSAPTYLPGLFTDSDH